MSLVGFNTLPGNTRVRTSSSGLVRLDELSASGPQGEQGPLGEKGDQGDPGTIDTIDCYSRPQTDFALMANRPSASLSNGVKVYDSNTNEIRNLLGIGGIIVHLVQSHVDPEDSRNGALVVNVDNVGGGSSIDPNVATFEDNNTPQAICTHGALRFNKELIS